MPVPDFSPGEVLNAAAMDSIGLWKISATTTITSGRIEVFNCFSANYDAYKIVFTNITAANAATSQFELYDGTNWTSSGFYATRMQVGYNTTTFSGVIAANGAANVSLGMVVDTNATGGWIEIQNPYLTERTTFQFGGTDPRVGGNGAITGSGYHNADTSFTGFRLLGGGQNITGGTVRVYGYRN